MLYLDSITLRPDHPRPHVYPFSVPALRSVERIDFRTPITLLSGDSGSGKSTLLEGLAAGMGAYAVGHHGQIVSDPYLPHAKTVADAFRFARKRYPKVRMFLRAEDVLGFIRFQNADRLRDWREARESREGEGAVSAEEAERMMTRLIATNPLDARSHGEGFLDILSERVHRAGLYFLDEPESPLSPLRQVTLAALVRRVAAEGGQLVIATHSPVLLAIPEATILHFDETGVSERRFEDLESIRFLRRFLERPGAFLDD